MANATELKFGDPETRIAQSRYWSVLLRPKQPTLGSLALVCREPAQSFAELSPEAFADLRDTVRHAEAALREITQYERINYLMLMMVDRDVHFHVIPRYAGSRRFADTDFPDAGWPGPPALDAAVSPEGETRDALIVALRAAWPRAGV